MGNIKLKLSNLFSCIINGFSNRVYIGSSHITYFLVGIIVGIVEIVINSNKKTKSKKEKKKLKSNKNRIIYGLVLNSLLFIIILIYIYTETKSVYNIIKQNKILLYTLIGLFLLTFSYVFICILHYITPTDI